MQKTNISQDELAAFLGDDTVLSYDFNAVVSATRAGDVQDKTTIAKRI